VPAPRSSVVACGVGGLGECSSQCLIEAAAGDQVVGIWEQVTLDVGDDLYRAVAELAADLEQVDTHGDRYWDGGIGEIMKSQTSASVS
jgi:hypothetical protein